MAYNPVFNFDVPAPQDTLWRYLSLPKFVVLLERRVLWFARADRLGDKHEGAYGYFTTANRRVLLNDMNASDENHAHLVANLQRTHRYMLTHTYISCWNRSERESAGLWAIYAPRSQSVAIRTTFGRLTSSLSRDSRPVEGANVKYIDYTQEEVSDRGNFFLPFTRKRLSFEHERETRLLVQGRGAIEEDSPTGYALSVDLEQLIEAIYVGPDEDPLVREAVQVLADKFIPNAGKVRQSSLDEDPLY